MPRNHDYNTFNFFPLTGSLRAQFMPREVSREISLEGRTWKVNYVIEINFSRLGCGVKLKESHFGRFHLGERSYLISCNLPALSPDTLSNIAGATRIWLERLFCRRRDKLARVSFNLISSLLTSLREQRQSSIGRSLHNGRPERGNNTWR